MTNPDAPPRAAVRDIADPHATAVAADRGTRLGAAILDGIIFAAMVYVPFLGFAFVRAPAAQPGNDHAGAMLVVGLLMLAGFITWSWFTIIYMKCNGQSIAKKLLGIKIVRTDGSPASLGRLFWLRNVVNGLVNIIPLYGMIDSLFIFRESRQCLHDNIADTIVIKA